MANTFATQMTAGNNRNSRKSLMAASRNSLCNQSFAKTGMRGSTAAAGSRRNNQSRNTVVGHYQTAMSYPCQSRGMKSAASLEVLTRAYQKHIHSPSPELEKKDEFAASSLWKMAAKANQEDF